MNVHWQQLARSERAEVGTIQFDVWRVGSKARYSVLNTATNAYVDSGECETIEQCKAKIWEWGA